MTYLDLSCSADLRSLLCSHSILSTAISQVSLTTSSSLTSSRLSFNSVKLPWSPNAPSASAASCLHIGSSCMSSKTPLKYGTARSLRVWPRQYANSCLSSAEGDVNAAAIASIAAGVEGVGGFAEARCLSEKRARKRFARGSVSEVSVLRNTRTAGSMVTPESC